MNWCLNPHILIVSQGRAGRAGGLCHSPVAAGARQTRLASGTTHAHIGMQFAICKLQNINLVWKQSVTLAVPSPAVVVVVAISRGSQLNSLNNTWGESGEWSLGDNFCCLGVICERTMTRWTHPSRNQHHVKQISNLETEKNNLFARIKRMHHRNDKYFRYLGTWI